MQTKKGIQQFLEWGTAKFSIYTIRNYKRYLLYFCQFIENKKIERINLNDILNFRKSLKDSGKKDSTIFFYLITIRQFFKFLKLQEIKCLNPDLIPLHKYISRSWYPAERNDIIKMLKVLKCKELWMSLRNELILKFLFSSGVRVSELCALTLDEINLKNQEAIIETRKNLKKRVIMWDDITHEVLCEYLDLRLKVTKCEYIFIGRHGYKLTTRHIERIIKILRERAGIKERIVPHSFRHGFGMWGIEKNINLRYLQILLGHKQITSSQIYMPYKEQNIRKEYRKIYNR